MDSDDSCAVCGTETTYHRQTINGSELTRCRRHSPKRGRIAETMDWVLRWVFVASIPVMAAVSAAHLFTDYSVGLLGTGDLPPEYQPLGEMWWYVALQTLEKWIVTGLSAVMLVCTVVLAVLLAYEMVRPAEESDE